MAGYKMAGSHGDDRCAGCQFISICSFYLLDRNIDKKGQIIIIYNDIWQFVRQ